MCVLGVVFCVLRVVWRVVVVCLCVLCVVVACVFCDCFGLGSVIVLVLCFVCTEQ